MDIVGSHFTTAAECCMYSHTAHVLTHCHMYSHTVTCTHTLSHVLTHCHIYSYNVTVTLCHMYSHTVTCTYTLGDMQVIIIYYYTIIIIICVYKKKLRLVIQWMTSWNAGCEGRKGQLVSVIITHLECIHNSGLTSQTFPYTDSSLKLSAGKYPRGQTICMHTSRVAVPYYSHYQHTIASSPLVATG